VQVNHRYVGGQTPGSFDQLLTGLRSGSLTDTVPPHGTLVRVRRRGGLAADRDAIVTERAAVAAAQAKRSTALAAAQAKAAKESTADAEKVADPDAATVAGPSPSSKSAPAPEPPGKPSGGAA
jgi:hypothetical protein